MSRGFNSGVAGYVASAAGLPVPNCCTRVVLAAAGCFAGQGAGISQTRGCVVAGTRPSACEPPPCLPPEPAVLVGGASSLRLCVEFVFM